MKTGRSHHGASLAARYEVKAELPRGGLLGERQEVGELLALLGGPGGG